MGLVWSKSFFALSFTQNAKNFHSFKERLRVSSVLFNIFPYNILKRGTFGKILILPYTCTVSSVLKYPYYFLRKIAGTKRALLAVILSRKVIHFTRRQISGVRGEKKELISESSTSVRT